MSLGLRRYDALYQETAMRQEKAAQFRPHLFDLYYSGLVETAINRETGNGSLNASYGKNLYENVSRLKSLDQSFDDLVFMRDAQVITSKSLAPETNNNKLLNSRKASAKDTLEAAEQKRKQVFDDYDNKAIDEARIKTTLQSTIESLRTELMNICGLPRGCVNVTVPDCEPRTALGFCGFDIPADSNLRGDITKIFNNAIDMDELTSYYKHQKYKYTDDQVNELIQLDSNEAKIATTDFYSLTNEGEAAVAIDAYRQAKKNVDIARAEFVALYNKVGIARSACERYAANWVNGSAV